jgi:hypothetical protein
MTAQTPEEVPLPSTVSLHPQTNDKKSPKLSEFFQISFGDTVFIHEWLPHPTPRGPCNLDLGGMSLASGTWSGHSGGSVTDFHRLPFPKRVQLIVSLFLPVLSAAAGSNGLLSPCGRFPTFKSSEPTIKITIKKAF